MKPTFIFKDGILQHFPVDVQTWLLNNYIKYCKTVNKRLLWSELEKTETNQGHSNSFIVHVQTVYPIKLSLRPFSLIKLDDPKMPCLPFLVR